MLRLLQYQAMLQLKVGNANPSILYSVKHMKLIIQIKDFAFSLRRSCSYLKTMSYFRIHQFLVPSHCFS